MTQPGGHDNRTITTTSEQLAELRKLGPDVAESVSAAATVVEQRHRAVAGAVFDGIGPIGEPATRVHDVIAGPVYDSIRGIATAVGSALTEREWVRSRSRRPDRNSPETVDLLGSPR